MDVERGEKGDEGKVSGQWFGAALAGGRRRGGEGMERERERERGREGETSKSWSGRKAVMAAKTRRRRRATDSIMARRISARLVRSVMPVMVPEVGFRPCREGGMRVRGLGFGQVSVRRVSAAGIHIRSDEVPSSPCACTQRWRSRLGVETYHAAGGAASAAEERQDREPVRVWLHRRCFCLHACHLF
jgi:hypothetical protein